MKYMSGCESEVRVNMKPTELITNIACLECKSKHGLVVGRETFAVYMDRTPVWLAPVVKCYACGCYMEPKYQHSIAERTTQIFSTKCLKPLRILYSRGKKLNTSERRLEDGFHMPNKWC